MQRIKVGMIGLAAVVLLIAIAAMILGSATRERPVATLGSARPAVVANLALTNQSAEMTGGPLAEMGISPSTTNSQTTAAR